MNWRRRVLEIVDVVGMAGVRLFFWVTRLGRVSKVKRSLLIFLRPKVLRTKQDVEEVTQSKYSDIWEVIIESSGQQGKEAAPLEDLYKGFPN